MPEPHLPLLWPGFLTPDNTQRSPSQMDVFFLFLSPNQKSGEKTNFTKIFVKSGKKGPQFYWQLRFKCKDLCRHLGCWPPNGTISQQPPSPGGEGPTAEHRPLTTMKTAYQAGHSVEVRQFQGCNLLKTAKAGYFSFLGYTFLTFLCKGLGPFPNRGWGDSGLFVP